ncbi:hypothetical protein PR048_018571 [Dryococelus australis]|uniref:Uncharacterized protein n=1 Tax=Dryococelus australis TaxID=614101 RepID=A0ABQ9HDD3_9NEOP|nr:hypothetical protein PR048_018571 [Dryococelus australis]
MLSTSVCKTSIGIRRHSFCKPFHELSNGFWPLLTSPQPAIQFVPKMFYRVEVVALGWPVQWANIVVGVPLHKPIRQIEVSMEQCRNVRAGETGDPRENPLTRGIVRPIPTCENLRVNRPVVLPGSPWHEVRRLTAQSPWPQQMLLCDKRREDVPCKIPVRKRLRTNARKPLLRPGNPCEDGPTLTSGGSAVYPVSHKHCTPAASLRSLQHLVTVSPSLKKQLSSASMESVEWCGRRHWYFRTVDFGEQFVSEELEFVANLKISLRRNANSLRRGHEPRNGSLENRALPTARRRPPPETRVSDGRMTYGRMTDGRDGLLRQPVKYGTTHSKETPASRDSRVGRANDVRANDGRTRQPGKYGTTHSKETPASRDSRVGRANDGRANDGRT